MGTADNLSRQELLVWQAFKLPKSEADEVPEQEDNRTMPRWTVEKRECEHVAQMGDAGSPRNVSVSS